MKKALFGFILITLFTTNLNAQKISPAKWSWMLSKANPEVGERVDIIFKVNIIDDWYLYSCDFSRDLGPIVTSIKLKANPSFIALGELTAINPSKKMDTEIWNGEYTYFKHSAEFRQKVKILKLNPIIEGSYDSQSCSDVTGQCVPVKGEFKIDPKIGAGEDLEKKKVQTATTVPQPVKTQTVVTPPVAPAVTPPAKKPTTTKPTTTKK
ncbi:MAG: hypothetical protein KA313_08585 [Pseudarcicella sp.]|jgi:thiol:disulfide interchange protein DsbD|nr:hypothetical protein [Pseudarcicella sp.]MBP6411139.1 hypothetical protein [Pseudarcicella sp.]